MVLDSFKLLSVSMMVLVPHNGCILLDGTHKMLFFYFLLDNGVSCISGISFPHRTGRFAMFKKIRKLNEKNKKQLTCFFYLAVVCTDRKSEPAVAQ